MSLIEELRKIMKDRKLDNQLKLKITFIDGTILEGNYEDYTQALDNDPEIASIGIKANNVHYELYENEIKSIEVV